MKTSLIWEVIINKHFTKKKDVYDERKIDLEVKGKQIITLEWFRSIWRLDFPHVKIPPRLGLCDKCVDFQASSSGTCATCSETKSYYDRQRLLPNKLALPQFSEVSKKEDNSTDTLPPH